MNRNIITAYFLLISVVNAYAQSCTCNGMLSGPPSTSEMPHNALQIAALTLNHLPPSLQTQQHVAIITGAMYDAYNFKTGSSPRLTDTKISTSLSTEDLVAYAGYTALRLILSQVSDSSAIDSLDNEASIIGLSNATIMQTIGNKFATAVNEKLSYDATQFTFVPRNPASDSMSPNCNTITHPNGWQPLCKPVPGKSCVPQSGPFETLYNSSLISNGNNGGASDLTDFIPPPARLGDGINLDKFLKSPDSQFKKEFLKVLQKTSKLGDRRKAVVEVFSRNPFMGAFSIMTGELVARKASFKHSVTALFAGSAAMRDAWVAVGTTKLKFAAARPLSVLQCGLANKLSNAWLGPYKGVGKRKGWESYSGNPPSPMYPSGFGSVTVAALTAFRLIMNDEDAVAGANCVQIDKGMSSREPEIGNGEEGFIKGLTNVPNTGFNSRGFVPAKDIVLCWGSLRKYADLVGTSRKMGGLITNEASFWGKRIGWKAARKTVTFLSQSV